METHGDTIIACRDCLGMVRVHFNPADAPPSTRIETLLEPITKRTRP
jgi:hypothetical protein